MADKIIPQEAERSKRRNELIQNLMNLAEEDLTKTIYLLYKLGATQQMIADELGTSREAIAMKYPKKGNHGK